MKISALLAAATLLVFTVLALCASPAGATHEPVDEVAIDVDVTGNTATSLGPTEYCNAEPLEIGETIDIDVVVRGVPEWIPGGGVSGFGSEGIWGYGFEIYFDPAVVDIEAVHAADGPSLIWTGEPEIQFVNIDYNASYVRIDAVDLGGSFESGDGILTRITVRAVGEGVSPLYFGDFALGVGPGRPAILDASLTDAYRISRVGYGALAVSESACPEPVPSPTGLPATPTPPPPPSTSDYELSFRQRLNSNVIDVMVDAESPGLYAWRIEFSEALSAHLTCEDFAGCGFGHTPRILIVSRSETPAIVGERLLGSIRFVPASNSVRELTLEPSLIYFVDPLQRDVSDNVTWEPTRITFQGPDPTPTPTFPPGTSTPAPSIVDCICVLVTPTPTLRGDPQVPNPTASPTPTVTPRALPRAGGATEDASGRGPALAATGVVLIVSGAWFVGRRRA